jgi:hypothetical protein
MEFMMSALSRYLTDKYIMHVNGYNVVPMSRLTNPTEPCRLTRYPESFAWATWERAWTHYDESLSWAPSVSTRELTDLLGSPLAAVRWKQNFADARSERINTWAYRWLASIWQNGGVCLSPNRNLVSYNGYDIGTHTRLKAAWPELPIEQICDLGIDAVTLDQDADDWVGKTIFGETARGNLLGFARSAALALKKHKQDHKGLSQ